MKIAGEHDVNKFGCKGKGSFNRTCSLREICQHYKDYLIEIEQLRRQDFRYCNYICSCNHDKFEQIIKGEVTEIK